MFIVYRLKLILPSVLLLLFAFDLAGQNQISLEDVSQSICRSQLLNGLTDTMPTIDNFEFRHILTDNSTVFYEPGGSFAQLRNYFINKSGERLHWFNQTRSSSCSSPLALCNPVIYKFTATEENASASFEFFSCQTSPDGNSNGYQVALVQDTPSPELIFCDEVQNDVNNTTVDFNLTNIQGGENYYLIIDGYSGSRCEYRINSIQGFQIGDPSPIVDVAMDGQSILDGTICPSKANIVLEIKNSETDFFLDSKWTFFDDNGNAVTNQIDRGTRFIDLRDKAPDILNNPGKYSFEVILDNPCTGGFGQPFTGNFEVVQEVASNIIEFDFCGSGPIDTLGLTFNASGQQMSIINPGTDCEAFIDITARNLNVLNGALMVNSCNQIEFQGSIVDETLVNPTFIWKDSSGNPVDNNNGDDRIFNVEQDGDFSLDIMLTGFTKECGFSFGPVSAQFNPLTFALDCQPIDSESISIQWDQVNRAESYTVIANGISENFTPQQLNTTITGLPRESTVSVEVRANLPGGCTPVATSSCTTLSCDQSRSVSILNTMQDTSICLNDAQAVFSFRHELRGSIEEPQVTWFVNDIAITGSAFDPSVQVVGAYRIRAELFDRGCTATTVETTIDIIGFDSSVGFDIAQRVCVNDDIAIEILGTQYDFSVYNFTAEGGAALSGLSNGNPSLRWQSVGTHIVSLFLESNNCRTNQIITREVIVEDVNGVDDIRVNANSKSAIFTWDSVDCADSYVVYVNDVREEVTTETTFTYVFSPIEDEVELRVGIESGTCFCPLDSPSTTGIKDNCPDIAIDIPDIQTICLDGSQSVDPIQLEINIAGIESEGDLDWSGLCVVQGNRFSPSCAGVGQHIITATYIENACVFSADITIDVSDTPDVNFEFPEIVCQGEEGELILSETANTMVFLNDDLIVQDTTEIISGDYRIEFSDADGCTIVEDFEVAEIPVIVIDLDGSRSVKQGFSSEYNFEVDVAGLDISNIEWRYRNRVICATNCGETLRLEAVERAGELCVNFVVNQLCDYQECIEVAVEPVLRVYTPNSVIFNALNSPKNNTFKLYPNGENSYVENIKILNRRGTVIYEENGLVDQDSYLGWDGLNQAGDIVPAGVYVYYAEVIDEVGNVNALSGDLTFFH